MAHAFILDGSQHQQPQQSQPQQAYTYSHTQQQQQQQQQPQQQHYQQHYQQQQQQPPQTYYGNSTQPASNGAHHGYVKSEVTPQHAAAPQISFSACEFRSTTWLCDRPQAETCCAHPSGAPWLAAPGPPSTLHAGKMNAPQTPLVPLPLIMTVIFEMSS